MKNIGVVFVVSILMVTLGWADVLVTKDGREHVGVIKNETAAEVVMEVHRFGAVGVMSFPRNEISRIERKPYVEPPPTAEPPASQPAAGPARPSGVRPVGPTSAPEASRPTQSPAEALKKKLANVEFGDDTFETALMTLRDKLRINISPNWAAMEAVGVTKATKVAVRLNDVTGEVALQRVLSAAAGREGVLDFIIREGMVKISTVEDLDSLAYVQTYDVRDLIGGRDNRRERTERLMQLVRNKVMPESWGPAGICSIEELNGKLVVTQSARGHRAIVALLAQLRK